MYLSSKLIQMLKLMLFVWIESCSSVSLAADNSNQQAQCDKPKAGLGLDPSDAEDCAKLVDIKKRSEAVTYLLQHLKEIEIDDPALQNDPYFIYSKEGLGAIKKQYDSLGKWTNKIGANYQGQSTANKEKSNTLVGANVEVHYETYPLEFRAKFDFQLDDAKGKVDEKINNFLINLDFYPNRNFEVFGFIQQYKIDSMGIDHRWESGLGAKIEWNLGSPFGERPSRRTIETLFDNTLNYDHSPLRSQYWKGHSTKDTSIVNKKISDYLVEKSKVTESETEEKDKKNEGINKIKNKYTKEYILKNLCYTKIGDTSCDWENSVRNSLRDSVSMLRNEAFRDGLNRSTSGVEFGVSISLLREWLDGRVRLIGQNEFVDKTFSFDVNSEQNTVLSLRPSFQWRIHQNVTFDLNYYRKYRLGKIHNPRTEGKTRKNFYSYATLDFKIALDNKVTISLIHERYFENAPYVLDPATVAANADVIAAAMEPDPDVSLVDVAPLFQELQARDQFTNTKIVVSIPLNF